MLTKKTYLRAINVTAAALVNLGLNYLLISRFEMMGAAYATLLSYTFLSVLTLYVSGRVYKVPYEYFRLAKMYLTALLLFVICKAIEIESPVVAIAVKTPIALCFPLILIPLKFYDQKEKGKILEIMGQLREKIGNWKRRDARDSNPK